VVALPSAQELDVFRCERIVREADVAAAVGNVVPHHADRGRHVLRLAQDEARDVGDLARRRIARERVRDVGDERVVRVGGIDLAERAARDLLVAGLGTDVGSGVDHDARDARLHRRRRQPGKDRRHRAQSPTGAAQPQLTHGCLLSLMRGNRRALPSAARLDRWIGTKVAVTRGVYGVYTFSSSGYTLWRAGTRVALG